jgi:hypothetical protein
MRVLSGKGFGKCLAWRAIVSSTSIGRAFGETSAGFKRALHDIACVLRAIDLMHSPPLKHDCPE